MCTVMLEVESKNKKHNFKKTALLNFFAFSNIKLFFLSKIYRANTYANYKGARQIILLLKM